MPSSVSNVHVQPPMSPGAIHPTEASAIIKKWNDVRNLELFNEKENQSVELLYYNLHKNFFYGYGNSVWSIFDDKGKKLHLNSLNDEWTMDMLHAIIAHLMDYRIDRNRFGPSLTACYMSQRVKSTTMPKGVKRWRTGVNYTHDSQCLNMWNIYGINDVIVERYGDVHGDKPLEYSILVTFSDKRIYNKVKKLLTPVAEQVRYKGVK